MHIAISKTSNAILTACTDSGKVFVFGRNKYGELGLGHSSSQAVTVPTPIHGLTGVVKVACGLYHSAAIDSELHCMAIIVFTVIMVPEKKLYAIV